MIMKKQIFVQHELPENLKNKERWLSREEGTVEEMKRRRPSGERPRGGGVGTGEQAPISAADASSKKSTSGHLSITFSFFLLARKGGTAGRITVPPKMPSS